MFHNKVDVPIVYETIFSLENQRSDTTLRMGIDHVKNVIIRYIQDMLSGDSLNT